MRLLLLLIPTILFGQTAVDSILTLKAVSPPAIGAQATGTVMNNGTIGTNLGWSLGAGSQTDMLVGQHHSGCEMQGSISVGGSTYTPAQPSQSFAFAGSATFTRMDGGIPAGHRKMSVGFCFGPTPSVSNLVDILPIYDTQGHYIAIQMRNTNQINIETDGSGTIHSGAITLTVGSYYYCTAQMDETGGTASLACYLPTYPHTQVGSTVTVVQQTGHDISNFRLGNNEIGTFSGSYYVENLMFDWTNGVFPLGVGTQYAPWTGIISPTRAIDWSNAGVVGGIPTRPRCTTGTGTSVLPAGTSSSAINTALSGCDSGHAVELGSGSFTGLGMITIPSGKTLRGQGADQTSLNFTSASGCTGQSTLICLAGDNTDKTNPRNLTNWTAGYYPGTTVITLAGPLTNLKIGNPIILDQLDDTTDPGGIVVSDTSSSIPGVSPGVTGPRSLEGNGGGSQRSGRQQEQIVTVTGCNGSTTPGATCSGSNVQITISPGLYMPNWDSSRSPQAWWSNTPHLGGGVENLSIDSGSDTQAAMPFKFLNGSNMYITGIRVNTAYRAAVQMQYVAHATIQNSYFFLNAGSGPTNYGIECYGGSDVLMLNNIFQAITGPIPLNSACEGNVIAYNYFTNIFYTGSAGWNNPFSNEHTAGTEMNLYEGNVGDGIDGDVFHGTHHFLTVFRNRFAGVQPVCWASGTPYASATFGACNNNRIGIQLRSWSRFHNLIGNVIGTSGTNTTYQSTAGDRTVYTLGNGNTNGSVTVPDDPNVATTLVRWGNWDVVSNANRWCGGSSDTGWSTTCSSTSEIPSAPSAGVQTPYSNFLPRIGDTTAGQSALPASFLYASQPSWWPSGKAWPPIGPDVTGGNVSGTGGRAYTIPAQDCALNTMGMPADGTGPVKSFNASTCYSSSGISTPTVTTTVASSITTSSASSGGTVTSNGGASITSEGVCYGTTSAPRSGQPGVTCTSDGTSTPFVSSLTGLTQGTLIHYNSYATNSAGTGYGSDLTFTTLAPNLSLNPASFSFSAQGLNTTSSAKTTTLTNTGTSTLTISGIALVGTNALDYTISSNTCGATVAVNGTCTVSVTFTPLATGSRVATLQFSSNDSGSPDNLTITGTGINVTTPKGVLVFGGAGFPGVK